MTAAEPDLKSMTTECSSSETVVEAVDLKRVYEVRRGLFRAPAKLQAVGGVSFRLARGRTLAVVGESGCGKSTLARMVSLIERPTSGRLTLIGVDAVDPPPDRKRELRQAVQLVFQNPFGSLNPRKKIAAVLEDPLAINTTLSKADRAAKARDMLARVGLRPEHANRYPHMFSGGQRQRIAIARCLTMKPDVLICDESVSALDVSVQAQVLNLLQDLQDEYKMSYIFISHDLAVVKYISDQVMVMSEGDVVEVANSDEIYRNPQQEYTKKLLGSIPKGWQDGQQAA